MKELVEKLSTGKHPVQVNRPDKSAGALKERIDLGYVHILFKETGTELGIKLKSNRCDFSMADFSNSKGKAHVEGGITLNYNKVKCVADIDLTTMEGEGYLIPLSDAEYDDLMDKKKN
ncbi:MbtH domain protein [Chitinophaga qingshengii]|uniref:MbtH domain protein n=1 Tax=Chitinophaga qingshengii TaxID=1569794 RepID=A0ABR7TFW3_9BACT|nr:MbtH domain protein [Chitinophaga qingshengii]MBC9929281.1 MbtH domain protein [Chitinophaga qingshengii]